LATRNVNKCPICRGKIILCLIPETNIVIDNYYEKIYKTPEIKKSKKPREQIYMTANMVYDEPAETKYYDADDSDYDSDNDGMN